MSQGDLCSPTRDDSPSIELQDEITASRRKRRRIDQEAFHGLPSSDENPSSPTSSTSDQDKSQAPVQGEGPTDQVKPKSKYKIHIPKNADLPADAFLTQPPQEPSSPYRIDRFHWRKPHAQSWPIKQAVRMNNPINRAPCLEPYENIENEPPQFEDPPIEEEFPFDDSYADAFAEIPSEIFPLSTGSMKSVLNRSVPVTSQQALRPQMEHRQRLLAPIGNLRQTTLFGTQAPQISSQTQSIRTHNWPLANREEPPTHHKLDSEALQTWVYPTNLGMIRDYQYSIVARGLYHNLLVALPTGLGKTFIAATIMLNWFRWTETAQIVFVAPTKPLVSQQVKACFEIAGIPRSATTMLTGGVPPALRAEEWQSKRVFFMTPQTIINDLKSGVCDPKRLVLLVVDEAHRATGGYAYVEVVKFLRRFNSSFRVLALTATPGASIEAVQEVIDGLGISRVEIRTEESLDIREYVHSRKIETILFDNSDEMAMVMDLFSRALQPVLDKLTGMNAYWARDPMTLTPYGCNQARQRWMASEAGKKADFGVKGMVNNIFSLLASLSHGIELLKFHGIGPFYHKVLAFRNEIHANGKKGGKYANHINESESFQTMMSRVQIWINNSEFIGHPKLEYLQSVVMNHFLDAGEGRGASDPSSTKVMVFAHYRDSAEEIARVLRRSDPMVRPHVFVGQANSKGSEGMDQKKQLDIIQKFKTGIYNTLVATSIGEEGLDIGEVDLIICYDASASPIRMLQRMGRTGRKRAGNIVVTLMKGKEENNFVKAKDNYEKMQSEIAMGTRFNFHDEESKRIIPKDIQPVVDKRIIEIPAENSQPDLPEPSKRGRAPKRPPKKFHMPDGVRKGFVKASRLGNADETSNDEHAHRENKPRKTRATSPEPLLPLDEVLLSATEERIFERKYLDIQGESSQTVEQPRNDAFPTLQKILRPTKHVTHSRATKVFVEMLQRMHGIKGDRIIRYEESLASQDEKTGKLQAAMRKEFFGHPPSPPLPGQSVLDNHASGRDRSTLRSKVFETEHTQNALATSSFEEIRMALETQDPMHQDMQNHIDLFSSMLTLPASPVAVRPLDRLSTGFIDQRSDSESELPEFGTLVHDVETPKTVASARASHQRDCRSHKIRRGKRKVVEDDSDDE